MNQLLILIGAGITAAGFLLDDKKTLDTPAKIVPNDTDADKGDPKPPKPAEPEKVKTDDPKPTE